MAERRWGQIAKVACAAAAGILAAQPALATCPIELAVYREATTGAEINFRPGATAVVTNAFRLLPGADVVLDGIVMWTHEPGRSVGMITRDCPEGDLTGEEIAACTVWEGVIYTSDASGTIGLLPSEGEAAPAGLILADLAQGIASAPALAAERPSKLPWDAFVLSGCQE